MSEGYVQLPEEMLFRLGPLANAPEYADRVKAERDPERRRIMLVLALFTYRSRSLLDAGSVAERVGLSIERVADVLMQIAGDQLAEEFHVRLADGQTIICYRAGLPRGGRRPIGQAADQINQRRERLEEEE